MITSSENRKAIACLTLLTASVPFEKIKKVASDEVQNI
jgi:hypothetical protein